MSDSCAAGADAYAHQPLDVDQQAVKDSVLARFRKSPHSFVAISAGAGSGKTKTVIEIILECLSMPGVEPDSVHATTFTNAAANDIRRKLIRRQGSEPVSIPIMTLHAHAIDTLKRLSPHIGGVSYYVEDLGGATTGGDDDGNSEYSRALRLSLLASIAYNSQPSKTAENFGRVLRMANQEIDVALPAELRELREMSAAHLTALASKEVHQERATHLGLGSFTNVGDGGVDFCVAVATDANMRLLAAGRRGEIDLTKMSLPKYLFVDEGQDADLNQLLYLHSLGLLGVRVAIVGDPRQTLYSFRNSVGGIPFTQTAIEGLMPGVEVSVLDVGLRINYRSRPHIVSCTESLSDVMRTMAQVDTTYIEPFHDDGVFKSRARAPRNQEDAVELGRPSVCMLVGGSVDADRWQVPGIAAPQPEEGISGETDLDPMALLAAVQPSISASVGLTKSGHDRQVPLCLTGKLAALAGGEDGPGIEEAVSRLYERSLLGESVAILTRHRCSLADKELVRRIIFERFPLAGTEGQHGLVLRVVGRDRPSAVSTMRIALQAGPSEIAAADTVPPSALLIAAAFEYFCTHDSALQERIEHWNALNRGTTLRRLYTIPVTNTESFEARLPRSMMEPLIELELHPFFTALSTKSEDDLGGARPGTAFRAAAARFVYNVLREMSVRTLRERLAARGDGKTGEEEDGGSIPFQLFGAASQWNNEARANQLRPWREIKLNLRRYWDALVNTPLAIDEALLRSLDAEGFKREWCQPDHTLINSPDRLRTAAPRFPALRRELGECLQAREEMHKQFSTLWHMKTKAFCRGLNRKAGELKREHPNSDRQSLLLRAHDEGFFLARRDAALSTFCPVGKKPSGLFLDFFSTPEQIQVTTVEDAAVRVPGQIDIATVHASKGLEWDHVVHFVAKPTGQDHKSSAKSFRDAIYVACTRAARTLHVVAPPKPTKATEKEAGGRMLVRAVHAWAESMNLRGAPVDYGPERPAHAEEKGCKVWEETSHTNLEDAITCWSRFDIKNRRSLPTMSPMSLPDYSFFFHSAMASLCSALAGLRVPNPVDPIFKIRDWVVDCIVHGTDRSMTEDELAEAAIRRLGTDTKGSSVLRALMQGMVPMYNRLDDERFSGLVVRYEMSMALHMAAILKSSRLLREVYDAGLRRDCIVLIEKPVREVRDCEGDVLPFQGIPDVRIETPEGYMVFDFKTAPPPGPKEKDTDYETTVSEKTAVQVNLYQGLKRNQRSRWSELIYVLNVTVPEGRSIPPTVELLPVFRGGRGFSPALGSQHARVLSREGYDEAMFEESLRMVRRMRIRLAAASPLDPGFSHARSLVLDDVGDVPLSVCSACPSRIHCQHAQRRDEDVDMAATANRASKKGDEYDFTS